jgi:hypothetical protein
MFQMKIEQSVFFKGKWTSKYVSSDFQPLQADLVLAFCGKEQLSLENIRDIKSKYPFADVVSATTAGEIYRDQLFDDSIVSTAIQFEKTKIKTVFANIKNCIDSYNLGKKLTALLPLEELQYILVLSDGNLINGTDLVQGIKTSNHDNVLVTGGLAGDGDRFQSTLVGLNENVDEGNVVLVGFYGDKIKVGHGSMGGWDEFGHERTITKSDHNILYELDGKSALDLYKEYLGAYADELPSSALLFPLSINSDEKGNSFVRTILSIDEKEKSMTFAGNMPKGSRVRLMKANFDKLIDASNKAARLAVDSLDTKPDLALMISCVGRKLILNERVEEELERALEYFGENTVTTGFYSYGEISTILKLGSCQLLNQTMTITTFTELLD